MTFDDILAQIIDLLTRQGRVSYSALKRRFDLNDDYLNDLKNELLFAQPVVDEDNRGLVWAGEQGEQGDAGGNCKTPVEWPVLFTCHSNPEKPPYACQTATRHV